MYKLTARERVLILILAVVAVLVGGVYFAVLPLMNCSDTLAEEISAGQETMRAMQDTLERAPAAEQTLADAEKAAEEQRGRLLPAMANDEVSREVTERFRAKSLAVQSLQMTDTAPEHVPAYGEAAGDVQAAVDADSELAQQAHADITVGGDDAAETPAVPQTPDRPLRTQHVTVSASGTLDSFISLADELARDDSMRLALVEAEPAADNLYAFRAELIVYMQD